MQYFFAVSYRDRPFWPHRSVLTSLNQCGLGKHGVDLDRELCGWPSIPIQKGGQTSIRFLQQDLTVSLSVPLLYIIVTLEICVSSLTLVVALTLRMLLTLILTLSPALTVVVTFDFGSDLDPVHNLDL